MESEDTVMPIILHEDPEVKTFRPSHGIEEYGDGTPTWYGSDMDFLVSYSYGYTEGWTTPGYWRRVKKGELLPHTAFRQFKSTFTRDGDYKAVEKIPGSPDYLNTTTWSDGWAFGPGKLLEANLTPHIANVDTGYFVQQAAAQIMDGFDALTFLVELKQLREMFVNIAKGIIQLATDAKRSKRQMSKMGQKAWDVWLEGRYAWRVLYYDIVSFNEALKQYKEARTRFTERAGMTYTNVETSTGYECSHSQRTDWVCEDTISVSLRGSVTADIDPPEFQFNPVQTIYETITLSFVLDWALNVGQALAAINFLLLNTSYSASGGVKVRIARNVTSEMMGACGANPSYFYDQDVWVKAQGEAELCIRTPTTVSFLPKLNPMILDSTKIMDLIALMRQRFK